MRVETKVTERFFSPVLNMLLPTSCYICPKYQSYPRYPEIVKPKVFQKLPRTVATKSRQVHSFKVAAPPPLKIGGKTETESHGLAKGC